MSSSGYHPNPHQPVLAESRVHRQSCHQSGEKNGALVPNGMSIAIDPIIIKIVFYKTFTTEELCSI